MTKNLDDYNKSDSFPHVRVAKKLRKTGKIIKQGDTVEYIICIVQNEEYASVAEKACYPEQVENGEFRIGKIIYPVNIYLFIYYYLINILYLYIFIYRY